MTFFFYTGIIVRDLDRSIKFYTEVIGMKLVARIKNPYTNGEFAELVSREGDSPILNSTGTRIKKITKMVMSLIISVLSSKMLTRSLNVSKS